MVTRTVTWGEALLVAAVTANGGLNQAVDRIRKAVGPNIGTRNSFSKLYKTEDPKDLRPVDQWRAWLLLAAVGEDPLDWGIYNDVVPAINADHMDELRGFLVHPLGLEPRTHCLTAEPAIPFRPRHNRGHGSTRPRQRAA